MANDAWTTRMVDAPVAELMDAREVAELFMVKPDTLREWIKAGDFPSGLTYGKGTVLWDWRVIVFYKLFKEYAHRMGDNAKKADGV